MTSRTIILIGILTLFLASAILYGISTYIYPSQVGMNGALALFGAAIIGTATFFSGIESISNIIEVLLKPQRKFSFYNIKQYKQLLMHQNFFLDVRGLRTQGKFPLDLDLIFVELSLSPNSPNKLPSNFVSVNPPDKTSNGKTIWQFINDEEKRIGRYLIIGLPGSGKTTLLRNIVSVLLAGNKVRKKYHAPNKLPILLNLRECAPFIERDEYFSLQDAIQNQVAKWSGQVFLDSLVNQINKGRCLIMLDGLDEVVNSNVRRKVALWIDKQTANYPKAPFIVTSRPFGYKDNPLQGMAILEVKSFSVEQVKKFIDNWYTANLFAEYGVSVKKHSGEIKFKSEDLFKRVTKNQSLAELAVNPLLVTMMAIVHDNRGLLPTRRVELYDEIFDVLLERHQRSKEIPSILSAKEQQKILQPLAYYMMLNELREIPIDQAKDIVSKELLEQNLPIESDQILKQIENNGILYDASIDSYGFAHLTFQEYLSAIHIKEKKLENIFPQKIEDIWWKETILLYAAKYDPSKFVDACLRRGANSPNLLALAAECAEESSVNLEPAVKQLFEDIFTKSVEHSDKNIRNIISNANLTRRLRNFLRISEDKSIDLGFITHSEYQLFIDEMMTQGKVYKPDHWQNNEFPRGSGLLPVVGVRAADGDAFCYWLSNKMGKLRKYRLPQKEELSFLNSDGNNQVIQASTWLFDGNINITPNKLKDFSSSIREPSQILMFQEYLFVLKYCLRMLCSDVIENILVQTNSLASRIEHLIKASKNASNSNIDVEVLPNFSKAVTNYKLLIEKSDLENEINNLNVIKNLAIQLAHTSQEIHFNYPNSASVHLATNEIKQEIDFIEAVSRLRQNIAKSETEMRSANNTDDEIKHVFILAKNLASQFSSNFSGNIHGLNFNASQAEVIKLLLNDITSLLNNFESLSFPDSTLLPSSYTLPGNYDPRSEINDMLAFLSETTKSINCPMNIVSFLNKELNKLWTNKNKKTVPFFARDWMANYNDYRLVRCVYGLLSIAIMEQIEDSRNKKTNWLSSNRANVLVNEMAKCYSRFNALSQVEIRSDDKGTAFETIQIVEEKSF